MTGDDGPETKRQSEVILDISVPQLERDRAIQIASIQNIYYRHGHFTSFDETESKPPNERKI
jgi:hypothetical protein